jgi:hypothetical protein
VAWFLLHGQPETALRRLRRGWQPARVAGRDGIEVSVATRYLSTQDMARAFRPCFHVERTMALPLLLPPPYLDELYRKRRSLFARLEPWERRLRDRWPFRRWGDHLALVLRARTQQCEPALLGAIARGTHTVKQVRRRTDRASGLENTLRT